MFDQLSDRLQGTLSELRSRGKLSESDVDAAMREIRLGLLEADVNFKVVKSFTAELKERCIGAGVLESLDPGQQVVKIVNEELSSLMGGAARDLAFASSGPTVILLAGLQGAGKTTVCAKLAAHLKREGKDTALAACDLQRPAAVEQLMTLGKQAGAAVYQRGTEGDPVDVAEWAVGRAREDNRDALIVDTAGRLHIDADLMDQLARIKKKTKPHNVLLVVDAMTGQEAVNVAQEFAQASEFDGVVMTKLDGDARGGAALSIKAVTGKPILYVSTGEKLDQLERFYPERMAGRILGMGDVLSLIEKAEQELEPGDAEDLQRKIRRAEFTLDDFLKQMKQVRKMGPLTSILGMLPGMGKTLRDLGDPNVDERELDRVEAIILSMTPDERARPEILDGSRRKRIARGSGSTVPAVKQLVRQFGEMRKLLQRVAKGEMPSPEQLLGGAATPPVRRR